MKEDSSLQMRRSAGLAPLVLLDATRKTEPMGQYALRLQQELEVILFPRARTPLRYLLLPAKVSDYYSGALCDAEEGGISEVRISTSPFTYTYFEQVPA